MNHKLQNCLILIFILSFISPIFIKLISFAIIPNEEIKEHILTQVVIHDSVIYLLTIIFTYISYLKFIPIYISYLLRTFSILTLIIYLIDIYTLKHFVTHININDINKYFTYVPKYISQQYELKLLCFLISIIIISILFIRKNFLLQKKHHYIFTFCIIIMISINLFRNNNYIHSWVYKNFIEYNMDIQKQSKDYSDELKSTLKVNDNINCIKKNPEKKNIIVLMVESFASYQSNYFSGIKSWTPHLDRIAKSNISIKNFHSNGFITEDAEISILTGLLPIYSPTLKAGLGSTAFQGFYSIKESLPNHLRKNNYTTEFITSSDLTFSNTGKWAKSLNFNYIEGSEHPFYNDKERYHFEAPADEFLFKRVLSRVDKKKNSTKPYFLFIKTVSSHIPFLNPENNKYSEEETIRYVDNQINILYKNLQKKDFFRNGMLIIVGDHHPIIPLKQEQIKTYGIFSSGIRVPFIVSFGEKKQKEIKANFHQVDIYNSIKNLTSNEQCTSNWNGDFLSNEIIPPKYVVYRRGDKRGFISIFDKNNSIYNIKLNGDNTKVVNQRSSDITKKLVNKINYERIQRQENEL